MSKKVPIWLTVTLVLFAALLAFQSTYVIVSAKYETEIRSLTANNRNDFNTKLSLVDSIYRNKFYGELDEDRLLEYILKGYVVGTGDKFGAYYNPDEFKALMDDDNANMQGIGVSVIFNADYALAEITNVMPDSPALNAGVLPGDIIISVGEEKVSAFDLGYEETINRLRGEAGTYAVFTVVRGENYSETVDFKIKRGYVREQTVLSHIYEPDKTIGIIKIIEFDASTSKQFFDAIDSLTDSGAEKFIFDVRYNPGGELESVTAILDFLLPEGPIIRTVDKNGNVDVISSDAKDFDAPMAVLINNNTASAAELFSAALKDYDKAALVGNTTYGKGSMQQVMSLLDGSALRITYKMYFPPFSDGYDGIGISPDIEIDMDRSLANKNIYKITDEEDTQLQAAIAYLSKK